MIGGITRVHFRGIFVFTSFRTYEHALHFVSAAAAAGAVPSA